MKRSATILLSALAVIIVCSSFMPAKKDKKIKNIEPVYVFGFSFSFMDSTIYFTDVHLIDSAQTGSHGMLLKRGVFSDQMKNYLVQQGVQSPTCALFFSSSKKKADKELSKVMKRYGKENNLLWMILSKDEFRFINSLD